MMAKLSRNDLWSLEEYSEKRPEFRKKVIAHKKHRNIALNDNARLYFEDEVTIRYQIQEMLRIEKVFDAEGILDELDAYNPLIPDGKNLKATFMLEYPNEAERREKTAELVGIDTKVWLRVEDFDKVYPITNEDLERDNEEKTSTVHFMRFELTPLMVAALKQGASLSAGCDHEKLMIAEVKVEQGVRDSLTNDLEDVAIN